VKPEKVVAFTAKFKSRQLQWRRKKMKKIAYFFAFIFFLFTVNSFVLADTIKIGVHGPMTGPAAEVGRYIKNGALIAMDEINAKGGFSGKKIESVFGDTESKPEVGVSVYERFMTRDKVDMVIGGLHSSVNIAMQEAAAKYDKLFVTSGPVSEILEERVAKDPKKYWMYFKAAPSYRAMRPSFRAFFKTLDQQNLFKPKNKTIAIIVEDTDYGRGLATNFEEAMKEDGWKLIATEVVKIDQADYSAQMSKLGALKADVLYTVQTSPAAGASLCKSFKESGIPTFLLVNYTPSNPDYVRLSGRASETLAWCVSVDWVPKYAKSFLETYRKRYNEEPGQNAGLQYDAMKCVFDAVKRAKSTDARKVAEAMFKIKTVGTFGVYQFSPSNHTAISGDDLLPVRFYQILSGKNYAIYPEKFKDQSYVTQQWLK
jgi:branched-chain amino acid transport system substrate-binding protein